MYILHFFVYSSVSNYTIPLFIQIKEMFRILFGFRHILSIFDTFLQKILPFTNKSSKIYRLSVIKQNKT